MGGGGGESIINSKLEILSDLFAGPLDSMCVVDGQ